MDSMQNIICTPNMYITQSRGNTQIQFIIPHDHIPGLGTKLQTNVTCSSSQCKCQSRGSGSQILPHTDHTVFGTNWPYCLTSVTHVVELALLSYKCDTCCILGCSGLCSLPTL